jgi:dihydroxyacetone kinase
LAFADAAGGASGALWGAGLLAAAEVISGLKVDEREALEETPDVTGVLGLTTAALVAIMRLGGAERGDKTLVDALGPFVDALGASVDRSLADAWAEAAVAARDAANATAHLRSRKGRAAVRDAGSLGTPDPGAVSMAIALEAAGRVIASGKNASVDAT